MEYSWKVFLWENGGKSTELTNKVIEPIFFEDRLDETLDTGEIILDSMQISTKASFPPKTKFRIERYYGNAQNPTKTFDMVVEHDDVEEYAGCPEICCHRIQLIEVSVIAQGMHVDNIALTYELQDVNLNYKTVVESSDTIGEKILVSKPMGHQIPIHQSENTEAPAAPIIPDSAPPGYVATTEKTSYFRNSYRYAWDTKSLSTIKSLFSSLSASKVNSITFTVPMLMCQGYNNNEFADLFEMNTKTTVYKIKQHNGRLISKEIVEGAGKVSGPAKVKLENNDIYYGTNSEFGLRGISDWSKETSPANITEWRDNFLRLDLFRESGSFWTKLPLSNISASYENKTVTFLTEQLSDKDIEAGYQLDYTIECVANVSTPSNLLSLYEKKCYKKWSSTGMTIEDKGVVQITTKTSDAINSNLMKIEATFSCGNLYTNIDGGCFLKKGKKYSCYQLLRKALLTVDTQIFNPSEMGLDTEPGIEYSIVLDAEDKELNNRLKLTQVYETTFENKNLWEVLLQIGNYIHAIPYLEFATGGIDKFILRFKQLGIKEIKEIKANKCNKITIFNSISLSDYFTQYDSYITNMFSPQNIVEEWIVPKTSSPDYLVSNETAELQTSFPISEIVDFEISYAGKEGGTELTEKAMKYVFEKSVYMILTSEDATKIYPAKGNALFYELGSNKIQGLNYEPPSVNSDAEMSLKEIFRRLFGGKITFLPNLLRFNDLKFHIKYRTQDSLRITQFRPDIQNFMKNSKYEKYPHHEQFYGQQDKIVDSERFSANLFGRLIRVGNNTYQRQENTDAVNEKESGDLVEINGDAYYVTATENEYYADVIFQKVTYSKNFNQLSNIVTIPSEPRFFEVSERSKIRREVRFNDFLELSSSPPSAHIGTPLFLNPQKWKVFVKNLLFSQNSSLPNFAYTKFIVDKKRDETMMFPSSDVARIDGDAVIPCGNKDYADCVLPLVYFPIRDGIVFEWNMEDNFKAGDFIYKTLNNEKSKPVPDKAYLTLQPLRYVDYMGRADLLQFKLFNKNSYSFEETQLLPKIVNIPTDEQCQILSPSGKVIGLDKDNREALSFNYEINLLHRGKYGNNFVTFPNLFGKKDSELKMCFLRDTIGMFDETIEITEKNKVADNVAYSIDITTNVNAIEVKITTPANVKLSEIKAIVLYQEGEKIAVYIAKNVQNLRDEDKLQSWWIYPVFNQ